MKKNKIVTLLILSLFILSACKGYEIETIDTTDSNDNKENISEIIEEDIVQEEETIEENIPEVSLETQATFEIFNPELTYANVYNGPLFDSFLEWNSSIIPEDFFSFLDINGVNYLVTAIDNEEEMTIVKQNIALHSSRILPIINPGYNIEETKTKLTNGLLTKEYKNVYAIAESILGSNSIKGLGELKVNEYGIQAGNSNIIEMYSLAAEKDIPLFIEIRNGKADRDSFGNILKSNPDTIFILHLDPSVISTNEQEYKLLLETYDNLYLLITANDVLYDEQNGLLLRYATNKDIEEAIQDFTTEFDKYYLSYVTNAVFRYSTIINSVPNKILWSTDLNAEYNYNSDVYNRLIKSSRTFIVKFDVDTREKIAYKNALNILGEGI